MAFSILRNFSRELSLVNCLVPILSTQVILNETESFVCFLSYDQNTNANTNSNTNINCNNNLE